mgnify:CR=1 FL=1
MNKQLILHSPFDIETHKKTFINYLEVVIDNKGTVHYAVPSHNEFLIQYAMKKLGLSRNDIYNLTIGKYPDWLYENTNCISVWTYSYIGKANVKQLNTLRLLKQEGLYEGKIE